MSSSKLRMCRMCLSTGAILRSLFTIFQDHNLVFIIRDYVRLEIDQNDNLPQMVCKSCAVKLIRVRENVSLFVESDRKLREKLQDGTVAAEEIHKLGQDRRKYARKSADEDGHGWDVSKKELPKEAKDLGGGADVGNFEFNEVKHELLDSESDEDIPLKILKKVVNDVEAESDVKPPVIPVAPAVVVLQDHKEEPEEFDEFGPADAPSPFQSDSESEEEKPPRKKAKKEKITNDSGSRRVSRRQTKTPKIEVLSDDEPISDHDDEDTDKTFELKDAKKEEDPDESFDAPKIPKKRGRKKRVHKDGDAPKPKKAPKKPGPKPGPKLEKPKPSLHDFKCYVCKSESLGSQQALIEHLSTHVSQIPYTCKECVMETVVLTRVRTLNTHMKMHEQPVKCDYCDRRYSNAAGKYYHLQTFHLGGAAPCLVNCEVCGKTCGSQNALKIHMKYHTTKLKCSHCDMVFNHPNKKRNHERTHDQNRGIECVVCKKILLTVESYDVHLKKHTHERSYACHLCSKKFNTSCNLITHLKVHEKNDNYRPAKSWVDHYTVLSRDPLHFKCNHCDRYNTDKVNNMISHLQAHFKEYECDQCQHKFATAKQLRAHYTTHTGEKPEKCKHCGKVFSTKNNLRIHLKAAHPEWAPQRSTPVPMVDSPQQQQRTATEVALDQYAGSSSAMSSSSFGMVIPQQQQQPPLVQGMNVLRS
uniref:Zinc finger protein 568 n=1 Tax=Culex pipiens TaxID=7175 RepID=A0A8D8DER3_CULPI